MFARMPKVTPPPPVCARCGKEPQGGWCLIFQELEGEPIICSRCVYQRIVNKGTAPQWRKP